MTNNYMVYAANTSSQTVAAGGTINFGSTVNKSGCGVYMQGGNVVVRGTGLYDVDANVTLVGTTAGTATVQIYKDGVVIPGAEAQVVLATDAIASLAIPCTIRETCCKETTVTVVLSGIGATVSNAAVRVVKE